MMGGGGMMNGFGVGGMGLIGGLIGLIFNLAIIVGIVNSDRLGRQTLHGRLGEPKSAFRRPILA